MGRPREFDQDKVLNALRDVFWQNGYEGTSYADIIKATGLQKGSLYAAFGDKRGLYQQALARYDAQEVKAGIAMLGEADTPAMRRIEAFINAPVASSGSKKGRWGCLLCNAAIDQAPFDKETETSVTNSIERLQTAIEKTLKEMPRYARAPKLRGEKTAALLSGYFGLRVLVKAGMSKTTLERAAKDLLRF